MNNKVTIDFSKVNESGDGLTGDTDHGFSYSVDETDGGLIKMMGSASAERWIIVLPQAALAAGAEGTAYTNEETQRYKGNRPALDAISSNQYLNSGVSLNVNTQDNSTTVDLSKLVYDYRAIDGETLTGTLSGDYKISIAAGATVTLNGVSIDGENNDSYTWAGLTCLGDATIILKDGTTNTVKGFYEDYPGIQPAKRVGEGEEYTLTVSGTGSLMASSNGYGAGIGGGWNIACGNITISGGTVTATGGEKAAGIGSSYEVSCGNIRITGGTVTAIGGNYASGIGSGYYGSCNNITITSDVTSVTATKGLNSVSVNSIGAGYYCTCGTVEFGDATVYNGSAWSPNPMVAGNYGGLTLAISTTTNTDDTWTLTPTPAPTVPTGAIDGLFTINGSGDQVYFSQGNLQATYNGSAWSWAFAANQWDYIGNAEGNTKVSGSAPFVSGYSGTSTTVDLFGWVGASSTWDGVNQYGITSSVATNNTNGYGNVATEALKSDWGATIGTGWRTLSSAEWTYVFNTRSSGSTVNGTSNARYTHATINTDGTGVNGMILFPDGVTIANGEATSWGTINGNSSWGTQCTTAQWSALAAKGCVFLPAAGYRSGTVYSAGSYGYYWSSSPNTSYAYLAYGVYFNSGNLSSASSYDRYGGFSVRLVKDSN